MSRIIASLSRVALVWTFRSSSSLYWRWRPSQPSVRSTIQGDFWKSFYHFKLWKPVGSKWGVSHLLHIW
jgi:hypothetical protein